jgi:hypothetical protein
LAAVADYSERKVQIFALDTDPVTYPFYERLFLFLRVGGLGLVGGVFFSYVKVFRRSTFTAVRRFFIA